MRKIATIMLLAGLATSIAQALPTESTGDQGKIGQLITQLGSASFREREAAKKELDAIGEPALDALRKASKSLDMEIANSAAILLARIELRTENARLLAPTYVELSLKETSVEYAVAELARQSGYAIVIGGDKSKLAQRKVTLETGKVPFWKALEMLCAKAELVELEAAEPRAMLPATTQPLPAVQPQAAPAIQVLPVQNPNVKPAPKQPAPKVEPKPNAPEGFSADAPLKKEVPQPAPVQPQAQVQPAPVQVQAANAVMQVRPAQAAPVANPRIILGDGKPSAVASHVEGAIRIRPIYNAALLASYGSIPQGQARVLLEVKSEPKMVIEQIVEIKIDRAIDNNDQQMEQELASQMGPMDPIQQQVLRRQAQLQNARIGIARPNQNGMLTSTTICPVSLKKGDKEVTSIKELKGVVSLKVRTPVEPVVTVENVLQAKGELVKGKSEAQMKIIDVKQEENGDIKVEVELTHSHEIQPQANTANGGQNIEIKGPIQIKGQIQIQIGGVPGGGFGGPVMINEVNPLACGLEMLDAKGAPLKLVQSQQNRMQWQQSGRVVVSTLTFRPQKGQEAAKLVFKATRPASVDVPFVLSDLAVK